MVYAVLIVCTVVMSVACLLWRRKKRLPAQGRAELSAGETGISVEPLPAGETVDVSTLCEITDDKLLARVNSLVPGLLHAANAVSSAAQSNGQTLYQAILPAGVKLTQSREIPGAVRGMYHGKKGIAGQANFIAAQKTGAAASAAMSAMAVAAVVVGQYYMARVDAALEKINDRLEKIAGFQNNEYRSRVFALAAQIRKMAAFQVEILENRELRQSEIDRLNALEQECIELLGQANLTVSGFAKKTGLSYAQYVDALAEAQSWYIYQQMLLEILREIVEIKHALHLGVVSREQCGALLPVYTKQTEEARQLLASWNMSHVKALGIEMAAARRRKEGLDQILHWLPGLFNNDLNFNAVSQKTVEMIEAQTGEYRAGREDDVDLFREDVRLIVGNGKVYYWPGLRNAG